MMHPKTDIEFLISAFTYSFALMNETFYLRKNDLKVIGVHLLDYSLVSECNADYESGLTIEEERDIKEAIIASEKKYDTHINIPRLTREQRFEIMKAFIDQSDKHQDLLMKNLKDLMDSADNYGIEFYKKGIKAGVEMTRLTHGSNDPEFETQWTDFYRDRTRPIALKWLNEKAIALGHKTQ